MALANLATYLAALTVNGAQITPLTVAAATVVAGRPYDLWRVSPPVGAVPTTAVAPSNATLGAFEFPNGGVGSLSIVGCRWAGVVAGNILICDRLSHQSGLSGIVTGPQTTNLPTAPLTRRVSGEGVMIGLTIYTAIGGTSTVATTITVSYTNQADQAGQISPAMIVGSTGYNLANRMIQIPLLPGDTGVKSVQSVTLAESTLTAGNFGVTLFRPLYLIGMESVAAMEWPNFLTGGTSGGIPEVIDGACLFGIAVATGANAAGNGSLILAEV